LRLGEGFVACLPAFRGADGLVFLLDAGNGVEEELREVADGESVLAVNTLASELLDGVGEKRVDAIGGVEVAGGVEELGGERFGIGLGGASLTKVIGTEGFVVNAEHAAVLAARTDVLALIGGDEFGRSGEFGGNG